MKKIYILVVLGVLLTISSCGNNNDVNINKISKLEKSDMFNEIGISYDDTTKEIIVGNKKIVLGFPQTMKGINSPIGERVYINSAVSNYYFFATNSNKYDIIFHYTKILNGLGYTKVENSNLGDNTITYESKSIQSIFPAGNIMIIYNENIPENLSKLNLEGNFVEVRMTN